MSYIVDSIARFKQECKLAEENLIVGKCQLCIDALLLKVPCLDVLNNSADEITPNSKCQLVMYGDQDILQLLRKCPCIKIVYPPKKPFRGSIDLSLFESCKSLELVRVPFNQIIGTEKLRYNLDSLTWIRGNHEYINESTIWESLHHDNDSINDNFKPLRIDEIFWDQFGSWPSLTYLCISRSNITMMNASTIPDSIKILDLRNNRISHFSNLVNYSLTSTITKLCLDYNSMKELPKLNANSLSSLVYLSLRGNLLDSVNGLRNFSSLNHLDLSENCITNIQHFLSEIIYLSSTLKTLFIEKNPISYDRFIQLKCQSVLCQLVKFNGKIVKMKNNYGISPLPVISYVAGQTTKLSSIKDFSTNIKDESFLNKPQENIRRLKKSKPSKERFVVINDDDNKMENYNDNFLISPKINERESEVKNFFFGGYSGSYGSYGQNNLLQFNKNETEIFNICEEQDHTEFTDNNQLINNTSSENEDSYVSNFEISNQKLYGREQINDKDQLLVVQEHNTSEWASEDTEESTMFLVEIYSNISDYEQTNTSDQDANYYFVRIRPRDGLIFEKDCTSGKIMQTLDLKILEWYKCLDQINHEQKPNDLAIRLYFDTCIASKKERIYRFLDEKSYNSFIDMFLSRYSEYRSQYDATFSDCLSSNQTNNRIKLSSNNNSNSKFIAPWFYMCLRCGYRTCRIITDCAKCGSDLIIKDENTHSTNNGRLTGTSNLSDQDSPLTKMNEETLDSDILKLDEDFFRSNIDHYLKLHIEIYLYERIDDKSLKSESVEALFHCQVYDFLKKSFTPGLAVLTSNYFFLFDYLQPNSRQPNVEQNASFKKSRSFYGSSSYRENKKKEIVSLIFYAPLATSSESSFSPLIISHLPKPIKNFGYWIELKLTNLQRKILSNIKSKRKGYFLLELVLFGDDTVGKAFLELLFEFQKICILSQNLNEKANSLIKVKSKLIDNDEDDTDDIILSFDETCEALLKQTFKSDNEKNITNDYMFRIFVLESFQFLQNVNAPMISKSSLFNNLFTINENIVFIIIYDHLIVGELFCLFTKITSLLKLYQNQSISKILKELNNKDFQDHIKINTLFKESILNLLPDIYIDKNRFLLVMRFREDDIELIKNEKFPPTKSLETPEAHTSSQTSMNLIIYEFKLQFLNLPSLIQTCQMICSSWENNFGVSLTLSKYRDDTCNI